MVVIKYIEILDIIFEILWDYNLLDMLVRTLKFISIGFDNKIKGNVNIEDKIVFNFLFVFNRENVLKLLIFVKSQILKEMNEKINEFDFKF